jgi:DNA-binding GntR family transcriptional regulator
VSDRGESLARLHRELRELILHGDFLPNAPISQVSLARSMGVSRTPLREALRMLQEEGLITSEPNHRMRVAGLDPEELDSLYSVRVLLEAHGTALSVPRLTAQDTERLRTAIADMHEAQERRDVDGWEVPHRRFHGILVSASSASLRSLIASYSDRAERYRRTYFSRQPRAWAAKEDEHLEILDACVAADASLASARMATHLAKTALTLMTIIAPEREPTAVRAALGLITPHPPAPALSRRGAAVH